MCQGGWVGGGDTEGGKCVRVAGGDTEEGNVSGWVFFFLGGGGGQ